MACEYCGGLVSHHSRCPNYESPKSSHYCSICKDGICNGEEYIENDNGELCHYECIDGIKELLKWLGYEIKIMEDTC